MIHTRLQLDPGAEVGLRKGKGNAVEIVVTDPRSESSAVIELSLQQLAAIRTGEVRES